MTRSTSPLDRMIVVVDIAGFTDPSRARPDRLAVRQGMYGLQVLKNAFAESDVDFDSCETEDRGDGVLVLLPPDTPKAVVADRLPDRIVVALRRYNWPRVPRARMRLRFGLNSGDVLFDGSGWVGDAIDTAFRILDAPMAKEALAESDQIVAFVSSQRFFDDVIDPDPGLLPELYRPIPVSAKTPTGIAYLRLHGGLAAPPPVSSAHASGRLPVEGTDTVLDVIPGDDLVRLREYLTVIEVPQLAVMVSRALGPAVPLPRLDGITDGWAALRLLTEFNAGADGVPPAITFLWLLAEQVGGEVGAVITSWIGEHARRLRLGPALERQKELQLSIPTSSELHLMIAVEPHEIDPSRCQLSFWRQDDPLIWPPTNGDVHEAALDELEYRVDEIVSDTERAWAGQSAARVIEFVLPRSLLTLPVQRWRTQHRSGSPRPLLWDYQLGVRSLERMRNVHWHREWRRRWNEMLQGPSPDRIYRFGGSDPEEAIDAVLRDPRWVGLVMEQPPSPQPQPSADPDPLSAALRAGLPLICWHPTTTTEDVRTQVGRLLGGERGFSDVLERRRRELVAAPGGPTDADPLYDMVVMFDDPYRVIDLDSPPISDRSVVFGLPSISNQIGDIGSAPVPVARVWSPSGERAQVGQPTSVCFALTGADPGLPLLPKPVRLRVLLYANDAAARPVTHQTLLAIDRTTAPITFTVTPIMTTTVGLTFRVYRDSDSQLLMEITTELPVAEPTGKTVD